MTEDERHFLEGEEKEARARLREIERKLHGNDPKGGGWNAKPIEEHLRDGTYRKDRHGEITPGTLGIVKPPGLCTDSVKSQQRWIRNASDEHAVRNGCRFNERLAEYTADFFPRYLRHSKGEWYGKPFDLNDFQRDEIIYPVFGWVRPDGRRRFRRTYIEMPKKVGKSTLAAGIGIYMLTADGYPGAHLWSLGADKSQARVVHDEAVRMVEASEELSSILKVNKSTFYITELATKGFYHAVSGDARGKAGADLHCAIADELHEWYGTEMWEDVRYAFRAKRNPLLFVITNAGDNLESVCYRQHQKARAILDGSIVDDTFFALIKSVSQEEAEAEIELVREGATEIPVARRCTPGLGSIIFEEDLLNDIKDAIQTPSEIPNLLRLTYGVWNTNVGQWLRPSDWATCEEAFDEEELVDWECCGGLDMSKTGDMTALTLMFREPGEIDSYRQLAWFWMPDKTIRERQHLVDYQGWVKSGHLRIGGEEAIETKIVEADIAEIFERFNPSCLAFDKMFIQEDHLEEVVPNAEIIPFPQTIMHFAGPTAEYERLILLGRLHHNNNPVLTWQASNCCVKCDSNKNKRPDKPKHGDIRSIDGVVAGIMALRMMMENNTVSDYENSGMMDVYGDG